MSAGDVTPVLVKRIVGVGGDTLLMRHGQLTVNGVLAPSPNAFALPNDVADQPDAIFGGDGLERGFIDFTAPPSSTAIHASPPRES